MRTANLVLPIINGILWGSFALFELGGFGGISYLLQIGNKGFDWFSIIPLIVLSVAVLPAIALSQTKRVQLATILSVCTFLALVPYACFSGGGV